MHAEHRRAVESGLADAEAISATAAQLAYAIRATDMSRGTTATFWLERCYLLVGRIALGKQGGLDAARQIVIENNPEAHERHLGEHPESLMAAALEREANELRRFEAWWGEGRILDPLDRSGLQYERDKEVAWRAWYACRVSEGK